MTTPLYRFLAASEIVRQGDEYFEPCSGEWRACTSATIGGTASPNEFRRPIPAEAVSVILTMESLERTGQILAKDEKSACELRPGIGLCDDCCLPKYPQQYVGYGHMVCLDCLNKSMPVQAQSIAHAHASANEARADEVEVCQRCGGPCKCGMMDEVNVFPKGRWT